MIDIDWGGIGPGAYGVFQDFDAADRPIGPPRFGPPPRLRTRDASANNLVLPFEPRSFTFDLRELPPLPCLRSQLGNGLERREVEREQRQLSYLFGGLDGENGGFAATFLLQGPALRMQRLHRQQADCSLELVGDFPFWFDSLHNSSVEAAVFAVTEGDKPGDPRQVRYFDRSGQRWQRELGVGGDSLRFLQPLREMEGDLLVHSVGQQRSTLRRIDGGGTVRWETELPRSLLLVGSGVRSGDGLLLGNHRESVPLSAELEALLVDPESGALRWRTPVGEGSSSRPIMSAAPDAAQHLFAVRRASHQDLIELNAQGAARALGQLPAQAEPLLRLEDGRVLAALGSHFAGGDSREIPGRALIRATPESARADDPGQPIEVDWMPRALALRDDGAGSLLLLQEHNRYVFETLNAEGGLRWRTTLPIDSLRGAPGFEPAVTLRVDSELVCLALRRRGLLDTDPAERSLSCLDRSDGSLRLLRADFQRAEDRDVFPLLLRDRGDGSLQLIVQALAACPSSSACPRSLQRIDFAIDGSMRWTALGEAAPPARLDALALLDDGRLLASDWSGEPAAPRRLLAIGAGGEVEVLAEQSIANPQFAPLVQRLEDGSLLAVFRADNDGRSLLRRLDPSGQTLVTFGFSGELASLVAAGPAGFAIAVMEAAGDREVRLYGANGSLRWTHALPSAASEQLLGLHLRADASVHLATLRERRLVLQRLSAADGRAEHAEIIVLPGPLRSPLLWTADGEALVLAEGARTHGSTPQPAVLQTLRLREPVGCSEPAPSGFWFDPGSAGQGLFFHPAAEGSVLTATWLTFTADGDTDRADLRWFSLFGETDSSGSASLAVQSSLDGRFASTAAQSSETVGESAIERLRCDLLAVDYRFDAGELAGRRGRLHLIPAAPQDEGSQGGGIWFDPQSEGQGLLLQSLELADGGSRLVGAWATFDPEGAADDPSAQHWLTLDGPRAADGSYRVDILRTIGGRFDGRATANHIKAGEATLRFEACDRLHITYRFSGNGAAEFAGLQGERVLRRLDGCPSPARLRR